MKNLKMLLGRIMAFVLSLTMLISLFSETTFAFSRLANDNVYEMEKMNDSDNTFLEEVSEEETEVGNTEEDELVEDASKLIDEQPSDTCDYDTEFPDEDIDTEIEKDKDENILGEGESTIGEQIVTAARMYINKLPYVSGGVSLTKGADCSGFIIALYSYFGIDMSYNRRKFEEIPVTTGMCIYTTDINQAKPGDVVKFNYESGGQVYGHVAIYSGNGKFIHSPGTGKKVCEISIPSGWTLKCIVRPTRISQAAGKFPDLPLPGTSTPKTTPAPSQPVVTNNAPKGHVDSYSSPSYKTVSVSGWAYDPDALSESIGIHIYVGGPAGSGGECLYAGKTDVSRSDLGIGGNHGFNVTFKTNRTGDVPVYIYAIDTAGGNNPCIGSMTVNVNSSVLSSTAYVENGVYTIASSVNENYVLGVDNGNINANCANVALYSAAGTYNQKFRFTNLGNGYYAITCAESNKAIEAYNLGLVDGTNVIQYDYSCSTQQQWAIRDEGEGYVRFINRLNGLSLDLSGGIATNGRNIQLYSSQENNKSQVWKIYKGSDYSVGNRSNNIITKLDSGYYLDADATGNVVLGYADNRESEVFETEENVDGTYRIKHAKTGKYLTSENLNAVLRDYDSSSSRQKWLLIDVTGTGYCNIVSYQNQNYRLDVDNAWATEGNNVKLFERNDDYKEAQMWKLNTFTKNNSSIELSLQADSKKVKYVYSDGEYKSFDITVFNSLYGIKPIKFWITEPYISFSSSNTSVIDIDNSTQEITVNGTGTAILTIARAESALYKAATHTITISVKNVETSDKSWNYEFCEGSTTDIAVDYIGEDRATITSVSIPSEIDGYTVRELKSGALRNSYKLESVTLPEGLKTIGSGTFFACVELTQVAVPSTVTKINTSAFSYCKKLNSIMIGPKTTEFGKTLFSSGSSSLVVYGVKGSAVQNYIEEYNSTVEEDKKVRFVAMTEQMKNLYYPDRPDEVERPVANKPSGSTVQKNSVVKISTETPDAHIYITIDGTEPSKTNYEIDGTDSVDVIMDITSEIKAIAVKEGFADSGVSTFKYYVKEKVTSPIISQEDGSILKKNSLLRIRCNTEDAKIYYSLDGSIPSVATGNLYKGPILVDSNLSATGNVVIKAIAVKDNYYDSSVVEARYTISSDTNELYGICSEDTPSDGVIENMWCAGIDESGYQYSGKSIKPEMRVYYGIMLLKEGTDYSISYKNNVNAYTLKEGDSGYDYSKAPCVIIKGKGNYSGTITKTFTINRLGINAGNTSVSDVEYVYNGNPQKNVKPKVIIKIDEKDITLKQGKDYIVEYNDVTTGAYVNPGIYSVSIQGQGNYVGNIALKERIVSKSTVNISKASINKIENQTYTGNNIELNDKLVLSYGRGLVGVDEKDYNESTVCDYTYSYENNKNIGTAKVIIKGKGDFYGERTLTFKITGAALKNYVIDGLSKTYEYQDSEIIPEDVKVVNKNNPYDILVEGKDYTITYSNNVKVGKAKVVVTGMGRYTGSLNTSFKIIPASFDYDINIDCDDIRPIKYQKDGNKPIPVITFMGKKLESGKDYTLSYKNNNTISIPSDLSKSPKVIAKGKGNFTGTLVIPFEIDKSALIETNAVAGDVVYKNKANICKPKIDIYDNNNKKLKAGKDYKSAITYRYRSGVTVESSDIIPAGTEIVAQIEGIGCYEGTKEVSFRFVQKSIESTSIKVAKFEYNGENVKPVYSDVTITDKSGSKLVGGVDYIIEYPTENTKTGSGIIRIRGIGNYGGYKDVKFSIVSKTMNYAVKYLKNAEDATGVMKDATISAGEKLAACKYTRTGYTFAGWNTKADGSGVSYSDKEIFRIKNAFQSFGVGITLYAQWE